MVIRNRIKDVSYTNLDLYQYARHIYYNRNLLIRFFFCLCLIWLIKCLVIVLSALDELLL